MKVVDLPLSSLYDDEFQEEVFQSLKGPTDLIVVACSTRNQLPWAQGACPPVLLRILSPGSKDRLHKPHQSKACRSPCRHYSDLRGPCPGFPEVWGVESWRWVWKVGSRKHIFFLQNTNIVLLTTSASRLSLIQGTQASFGPTIWGISSSAACMRAVARRTFSLIWWDVFMATAMLDGLVRELLKSKARVRICG